MGWQYYPAGNEGLLMKAMIFAAGLGTRLRPLTDSMPKALVPVDGIPMLERVILKLKAAGFDEIVINVHHFASQITDFLSSNGNFGLKIDISAEAAEPLETGGGIRHAGRFLQGDRFLVHNVDILSDLDIRGFISHDDPSFLATLLLVDRESDRYLLFDDDMNLAGWTNVKTGEVKSPFPGFNPADYHRYSFCGIHIVSDEVFPLMKRWPEKFSIIDFYLNAAAGHKIHGIIAPSLKLIDIGSPAMLAQADKECAAGYFPTEKIGPLPEKSLV